MLACRMWKPRESTCISLQITADSPADDHATRRQPLSRGAAGPEIPISRRPSLRPYPRADSTTGFCALNSGRVAEWSMAAVLKTEGRNSPVGSNPTSSASSPSQLTAIDGTLGSLDYRGGTWKGYLVLPGAGGAQVECIFDRSKNEDFYNQFGNKRVSISGTAIYTGDSLLPERIEVMRVEEVGRPVEAIDIRGSLSFR